MNHALSSSSSLSVSGPPTPFVSLSLPGGKEGREREEGRGEEKKREGEEEEEEVLLTAYNK